MKTKKEIKTAVEILKRTTSFKLGHLTYKVEGNKRLEIWSTQDTEAFYSPEIVPLFGTFDVYFDYDIKINKVVMNIF